MLRIVCYRIGFDFFWDDDGGVPNGDDYGGDYAGYEGHAIEELPLCIVSRIQDRYKDDARDVAVLRQLYFKEHVDKSKLNCAEKKLRDANRDRYGILPNAS